MKIQERLLKAASRSQRGDGPGFPPPASSSSWYGLASAALENSGQEGRLPRFRLSLVQQVPSSGQAHDEIPGGHAVHQALVVAEEGSKACASQHAKNKG